MNKADILEDVVERIRIGLKWTNVKSKAKVMYGVLEVKDKRKTKDIEVHTENFVKNILKEMKKPENKKIESIVVLCNNLPYCINK